MKIKEVYEYKQQLYRVKLVKLLSMTIPFIYLFINCTLLPSLLLLDLFIPISLTALIVAFMLISLALEFFTK